MLLCMNSNALSSGFGSVVNNTTEKPCAGIFKKDIQVFPFVFRMQVCIVNMRLLQRILLRFDFLDFKIVVG